jgi:hypothetical protein
MSSEKIKFICGVTKRARAILLKLKCQGKPLMQNGEPRVSTMLVECNRKKEKKKEEEEERKGA